MPHPAFTLIHQETIDSLNVTFESYEHQATGARHLHLRADDNNNAFLVAFLTVPDDSTGVAHILEHTSLCGSRRFPVRDPFFMMLRRSLNTFMNAFTSSDWTAYPFASQNAKDFNNLLQVYLDATFFPNLNELDFAQEGHRLEFSKPDDPSSELVYKGVVYNEMKGAMSSPVQTLWVELSRVLFPTTTYHHNSGGDPLDIPKLTHTQLKDFHATHYHPSNAVFMTYGDMSPDTHQTYFHDCALQHFQRLEVSHLHVPNEQRFSAPVCSESVYALDSHEDAAHKTHIVLGWLLGDSTNPRDVMNAHLLSGVLLDNSASPLRHALEISKLGTAPSPLCGVDTSSKEMVFGCGLEGSDPEHAQATEALVMKILNTVADEGIPPAQIESVLHQIELHQREITGDHYPYGLRLMLQALPPALHSSDPVKALNIEATLAALREDIQNPDFIKNLVRRLLVDNPHRVRFVMRPDQTLNEQRSAQEKATLTALKDQLNAVQQQQIVEKTAALEQRQNTPDDPELLPKVTLADVPEDIKVAEGEVRTLLDTPAHWYVQGTNGMVYQQIVVDLPPLDDELLELLPLFCDCLTEVGVGDKDYLAAQHWQSAVTGGVSASCSVRGQVDDVQKSRGLFVLSGKALARNHAPLTDLLHATFSHARFDEMARLRELISQIRVDSETSITSRGSALAMNAACSGLSPVAALSHRWGGLASIQWIKQLDERLNDAEEQKAFAKKFELLRDALQKATRQFLIISEPAQQQDIDAALQQHWAQQTPVNSADRLELAPISTTPVRQAWATSTQVCFNAKAYPTVPYEHPDAPVLMVLGEFLHNGYLHRAIREQGGAYGGNAGYDSNTGAFRFYSYRDPRLQETLEDFDKALEWLQSHAHEARDLEEAVLSVVSRIDRPGSPAGEAKSAFYNDLNGRTAEQRWRFRSGVLKTTLADLQRVGRTYLQPEHASIAVISDTQRVAEVAEVLHLEVHTL